MYQSGSSASSEMRLNAKRVKSVVHRTMVRKFPEIFEREARFYLSKFGGR